MSHSKESATSDSSRAHVVMPTIETDDKDEDEDVKMEGGEDTAGKAANDGQISSVTEAEWDAMHNILNAIYDFRTPE